MSIATFGGLSFGDPIKENGPVNNGHSVAHKAVKACTHGTRFTQKWKENSMTFKQSHDVKTNCRSEPLTRGLEKNKVSYLVNFFTFQP